MLYGLRAGHWDTGLPLGQRFLDKLLQGISNLINNDLGGRNRLLSHNGFP